MFDWKKWAGIGVIFLAAIIILNVLGQYLELSFLIDYWWIYTSVLIIGFVALLLRSFYYYKKSQWEMYPKLKERALDAAKEKKGIITLNDLGKHPSEWNDWILEKFEKEEKGIVADPRNKNEIFFPEIIAESHTPDEVVELDLPSELGSKVMRLSERKQED